MKQFTNVTSRIHINSFSPELQHAASSHSRKQYQYILANSINIFSHANSRILACELTILIYVEAYCVEFLLSNSSKFDQIRPKIATFQPLFSASKIPKYF